MRHLTIIFLLLLTACGGTLSDEQRKKMKEQMELHKIKRVTDVEITEAAYAKGREIVKNLLPFQDDSIKRDSVLKTYEGRVRWIAPGTKNAIALEQQLIDAYLSNATGNLQDNVQKLRNAEGASDSLLYTKPVVKKLADGSDRLEGVWNIWLSKKQLILAMPKK